MASYSYATDPALGYLLRNRFDKHKEDTEFPLIPELKKQRELGDAYVSQGMQSPTRNQQDQYRQDKMKKLAAEAVKPHTTFIGLLMLVIICAIQLPSLGIAGSDNTAPGDIFRSLAVVLSLFLTAYSLMKLFGRTSFDLSGSVAYSDIQDSLDGRSQSLIGRLEFVGIMQFICLMLEATLMSIGKNHGALIGFGIAAFVLRFITLCLNAHAIYRLGALGVNSEFASYTHVIAETEDDSTLAKAPAIETWHVANRLRHLLGGYFLRGRRFVIATMVILFVTCVAHFSYEFFKIFSHQSPLTDEENTKKYNKHAETEGYMPERVHDAWKVHLVVVDGLRYDLTEDGASALGNYIHQPAFAAKSRRLKARSQLPSFSVPNWAAILTGALPETTGVTGNIGNADTNFDNIFQKALQYGVHSGMTGTPWWRDLVFSSLPPLDSDGTVDAAWESDETPEYPHETSDPADWRRLEQSLKAMERQKIFQPFGASGSIKKFMYELFLTHFSDVDKQGHEYGIAINNNPWNSYMQAIENKTNAIDQIVQTLDDKTILIVTSDHGHIMRGGHGGVSEVLLEVPVVFYTKNPSVNLGSGVASSSPNGIHFTEDSYPRKDISGGYYSNLDLCSTITALLGIPAPRQSIGVFMEGILHDLLGENSTAMDRLYYDLFVSKLQSARSYAEQFEDAGILSSVGDDADLQSPYYKNLLASNGSLPRSEYTAATRKLIGAWYTMRQDRKEFVNSRNIGCSVVTCFFALFIIFYGFDSITCCSFSSITKKRNLSSHLNSSTFYAAFCTILAFYTVSIVAFVIWYQADGYTVWDSTLTHTPSVASKFLIRTIVVPIVAFVVITKAFLAHAIVWELVLTWGQIQARREKEAKEGHQGGKNVSGYYITDIFKLLTALLRDLKTFAFATSRYKPHLFPRAVMYINYTAFWTTLSTLILLMCLSPYTYLFPIVFSTEHVTEKNLEYRFRLITVLMMVCPLQIGTALLMAVMPRVRKQDQQILFDHLYVTAYLHNDLQKVDELADNVDTHLTHDPKVNGIPNNAAYEQQRMLSISREERTALVIEALNLIMSPNLRIVSDLLHLCDLSEVEFEGEDAEEQAQQEEEKPKAAAVKEKKHVVVEAAEQAAEKITSVFASAKNEPVQEQEEEEEPKPAKEEQAPAAKKKGGRGGRRQLKLGRNEHSDEEDE